MTSYFEAIEHVRREIAQGYAICYATGYDREEGRYLDVQTDQGWSRWWTEFTPEVYANPEGSDVWL